MSEKLRTVLSWSSGKDSAWALHSLRQTPDVEVVGLLTTINVEEKRVSVHSTREDLLDMQAEAADLPLQKIPLPDPCPNEVYERAMEGALGDAKTAGVEALAFGDLFLEDIRRYREESLAGTGMQLLFPLWGSDTRELAHKMLDSGLRAWVVCVDASALDPSFAGRAFDRQFLEDLPANVDPCGEDGEFHTFTFDGPMFRTPIPVQPGDIAERGGFVFADVSAAEGCIQHEPAYPAAGAPSVLVPEIGLCSICHHARIIRNARGSTFWRCAAAEADARLLRYPRLPVTECHVYEPRQPR